MSNTTLKIVIGGKPLSDGLHAVYLRIIKNRKKKEINLGLRCTRQNFINEQFVKGHPDYKIENQLLLKLKTKAYDIIRDFRLQDYDFTLNEFENKFRGNDIESEKNINAISFFDEIITEMEVAGRIGNSRAYRETKTALIKYAGDNIYFKEITVGFLEKFESILRQNGNGNGGIAFKMRELRALFNKAINRGLISQDLYPFKRYKISKLKLNKNKRALTIDEFKRIRDLDLSSHPHLQEAHNYFMFSFYTRGMNFIDLLKLKWTDIQNGRIHYTRSKTKGQFSIEIIKNVQEILNFYKAQNRDTDYVFPILLSNEMTPKQIDNRKHKVLQRVNFRLKEIGHLANVETKLTSYVARHSMATILKQMGTSTDIISEIMGHSDVQVTMTYLKEFDNDILDKENKKLLDL
nr:site-specific integrase [uncultured Psychroserpens sp.]